MKYAWKLSGHPVCPESIPLAHPLLRAPGFNLTVIYASQRLSITLIRITCRYLGLIRSILSARLLFPVSHGRQARLSRARGLLLCPIALGLVAALQSRFLPRECLHFAKLEEEKCALHYGHIAVGVTAARLQSAIQYSCSSSGDFTARIVLPVLRFRSQRCARPIETR